MATIKRKQLKGTHKISRSLKKSIKKNLVKIVEKREREVREEEREKSSVRHKAVLTQIRNHLDDFSDFWACRRTSDQMSHKLEDELSVLIDRGFYCLAFEKKGQEGGLMAQKAFARKVLANGTNTEKLREEIREWLIDQGEDADEIEKLRKEEQNENEDEESGVETTEEYDWTSTSTLE